MFVFFNYYPYRIVSKITIPSLFVSIRIMSCDDRIVSSLICTCSLVCKITMYISDNHMVMNCQRSRFKTIMRCKKIQLNFRGVSLLQTFPCQHWAIMLCNSICFCLYCCSFFLVFNNRSFGDFSFVQTFVLYMSFNFKLLSLMVFLRF